MLIHVEIPHHRFKPHLSATTQTGGMILNSKVPHNAHLSSFPKARPPIPIPTRPSQAQSCLVRKNGNENGAASCLTVQRLILVWADFLYAGKSQTTYRHSGGRERSESTCSDEDLESREAKTKRYHRPAVHTPERPFVHKSDALQAPQTPDIVKQPKPPSQSP